MACYTRIEVSLRLLPLDLQAQLTPGTSARALHYLINESDLSAFDARYRYDVDGATAPAPKMPLRAVLLGYSRGQVSSRSI